LRLPSLHCKGWLQPRFCLSSFTMRST
jgi:hypothetical protein